jgi:hypothetical protein
MNSDMWRSLCDDIPSEATPHEVDEALTEAKDNALSEDERAALWLYVWSRDGHAGRASTRPRLDSAATASPAMIRYLAVLIRSSLRA